MKQKTYNDNYHIICANCKHTNILDTEELDDYNNGLLHCKYCLDFLKTLNFGGMKG